MFFQRYFWRVFCFLSLSLSLSLFLSLGFSKDGDVSIFHTPKVHVFLRPSFKERTIQFRVETWQHPPFTIDFPMKASIYEGSSIAAWGHGASLVCPVQVGKMYPLVIWYKAMGNGTFLDGLPIRDSTLLNYQLVSNSILGSYHSLVSCSRAGGLLLGWEGLIHPWDFAAVGAEPSECGAVPRSGATAL